MKIPARFLVHAKQLVPIVGIALFGLSSGAAIAVLGQRSVKPAETPLVVQVSPRVLTSPSPSQSPLAVVSLKPVSSKPAKKSAAPPAAKPIPTKRSFIWGATVQPFPFREANDTFLPEQFRLAEELGLKTVRIEYSVNNLPMNKIAVDAANKYGLKLVFIIPFGPNDIFSDPQLYDNAYRYVADIVGKHKGQVPVWQLATEVASVALIDAGHHGVDAVDYPEAKYQAVSTWLKAAIKAVTDTDPTARTMINDQWVHVGFFERFLKEGGNPGIIGWNWFSDMGKDMNKPVINAKTGQKYELLKKLKSFNRDIWLTEVNRRLGSQGGKEQEQADFIQHMAEFAYAEPAIKAFLVYNLVEDHTASEAERGYGLLYGDTEKNWVAGPKPAFHRYQDLIRAKK